MKLTRPYDPRTINRSRFVDGEDDVEVAVDAVFAKEFASVLADASIGDPESVAFGRDSVTTASVLVPGYEFVGVDAGVLLRSPEGDIVGGYLGLDVAIERAHRSKGLGAELVLETSMRGDGVPQWSADKVGYSPDGYSAHGHAWDMCLRPGLFATKAARLLIAEMTAEGVDVSDIPQFMGRSNMSPEDAVKGSLSADGIDATVARLESYQAPAPKP